MLEGLNFTGAQRLPMIYQTEAMECGLASMAMVAKYHGHNIDLNGLRQRFPVSLKGATLTQLMQMANQLDLGPRALRLELEDLPKLQTPAILHWDLNHFVVLKKVSGNKVHIHDPAIGAKVISLKKLSDHFTGVALELTPIAGFSKQTAKKTMRMSDLWRRLVGMKRGLLQLLILSIVLQLIVLAAPFYLQLVIDEAVVKFDLHFLLMLALAFGGLAVIRVITQMMREWTILYFGYQMSFQMVANLFRHLIHLPTGFFEKRHIGDVLSRMRSTSPIQEALTQSVVAAIIDGIMAVITGIVIFLYSPLLGTIVLVSVALLVLVTFAFYPVLRRTQEEMIVKEAFETTHRIESIRGSTAIKLFSAQTNRMVIWRNLYAEYVNAGIAHGKYGIIQRALQDGIAGLQMILVIYFGAKLILAEGGGLFTVGMLFAFMSYRQSFTDAVISLFNKFIEFRLLGLHLERIADIAQAEPEDFGLGGIMPEMTELAGEIEVRNLSFRYSPSDPWVLENLNLQIGAGDFIALTGPSGGGKTTLLKLLLGLYEPTEGEILIDGQPLTPASRLSWRRNMGVVMQDDALLSGTIAENIAFFDPQVSMERVEQAARLAQIHDAIDSMPMKYLSMIGDMGSILSGGQKQRVLLARALYKNPQILFLDEGTANLDKNTEKIIVDIIEAIPMTRIIVAHRQEFLKRVDKTIEVG